MLVAYFTAVWLGAKMLAAEADLKKPLEIVDFVSEGTSSEPKAQVMLVQNQEQWAKAWIKHRQWPVISQAPSTPAAIPDLPTIDFERTEIVAVFGGLTRGMTGYKLDGAGVIDKHDVIRLEPQFITSSPEAAVVTQPYAFIQIARGKRALDIEMLGATDQDGNPTWKKIARFEKPKSDGDKKTSPAGPSGS